MRVTTVFRKLLGVTKLVVGALELVGKRLELAVEPMWSRPRCPKCTKPGPVHETREVRAWRDLAFGETVTLLKYAPRRVDCATCGVHVEDVPWAAAGSRFTRRMEEYVAYLAQLMSKTAVCRLVGIDWRTVGNIIERVVSERLDPSRLDDLTIIGVDELSFRKNHEYVTVVVDHVQQRVVWVGEGKSSKTLGEFFKLLGPERAKLLTHVTMDMSAAFIASVKEHAPQAERVFDRFHVQRLASDAVDEVRRSEMREAKTTSGAAAKALKGLRWTLLKGNWNLDKDEKARLSSVQQTNKRLYRAYLLKESLAKLLSGRQPGVARTALKEWVGWASRSRLKPFVRLARTLKKFTEGIIAYISTGLSNGPTEGFNNRIRLITRMAYGFHSAAPLMAMIHLCCGKIVLNPPLPAPTGSP